MDKREVRLGRYVRCIDDSAGWENFKKNDVLLIVQERPKRGEVTLDGVFFNVNDFELVQEDEQMFDMKSMPWYILVSNETEYEAAIAFAESQGCEWTHYAHRPWNSEKAAIGSNIAKDGLFYWTLTEEASNYGRKEIKLAFKTVIDKVEYPAVESKEQLEKKETIEKLERSIEEAKQQIAKLKGVE